MCFGGGGKQVKPEPTYPVRFAYNQPVPNADAARRQRMAAADGAEDTFGADLGGAPQDKETRRLY